MTFYRFEQEDIINTKIVSRPRYTVQTNGDQVTGSVYLEKPYLNNAIEARTWKGLSVKEGGEVSKTGPFTASVDVITVVQGGTNQQLYQSILSLYDYYSLHNSNFTSSFTGSATTRFRVITIPEIYYDRQVHTGSLSASDQNSDGEYRYLFDDARGGIYSGSLTGTLVGNIFYSEGLVVLKGGGLNESGNDFGLDSSTNFKWNVDFEGTHTIPVNIFRCRAPAGELNASTNSSFYTVPTLSSSQYKNERVRILSGSETWITRIGLYSDRYELLAVVNLAQPIKKVESDSLLFRIRIDR